jgi:hypothetical protein
MSFASIWFLRSIQGNTLSSWVRFTWITDGSNSVGNSHIPLCSMVFMFVIGGRPNRRKTHVSIFRMSKDMLPFGQCHGSCENRKLSELLNVLEFSVAGDIRIQNKSKESTWSWSASILNNEWQFRKSVILESSTYSKAPCVEPDKLNISDVKHEPQVNLLLSRPYKFEMALNEIEVQEKHSH